MKNFITCTALYFHFQKHHIIFSAKKKNSNFLFFSSHLCVFNMEDIQTTENKAQFCVECNDQEVNKDNTHKKL